MHFVLPLHVRIFIAQFICLKIMVQRIHNQKLDFTYKSNSCGGRLNNIWTRSATGTSFKIEKTTIILKLQYATDHTQSSKKHNNRTSAMATLLNKDDDHTTT